MKIIFIFTIFLVARNVCGYNSEFLTFWAPKASHPKSTYSVFFQPFDLENDTDISVQYGKSVKKSLTINLIDEKFSSFSFPVKDQIDKNVNLTVTLFRKASIRIPYNRCITKVFSLDFNLLKCYTFIQLDKPIYKPEDIVRFRVIVVDRNLIPYKMNNIEVIIYDPHMRPVKTYNDFKDGQNIGIFKDELDLTEDTILGAWTIRVEVDKSRKYVFKRFSVQKYTLPLFKPIILIDEKKLNLHSTLAISAFGVYPFGELVKGNANLTIYDEERVYYSKSYTTNPNENSKIILSVMNDLKITAKRRFDLKATLTLTEEESGISLNTTDQFYVFGDSRKIIKVTHPEKFWPGRKFLVHVRVFDWNWEPFSNNFEDVKISYTFTYKNEITLINTVNIGLKSSSVEYDIPVPEDVEKLDIEVKFIDSDVYRTLILKGEAQKGINSLYVSYRPEKVIVGDLLNVAVSSERKIRNPIVSVTTRFGNIQMKKIECDEKFTCEFNLTVTKEMIPLSSIFVYSVDDIDHIYYGVKDITTEELGRNKLHLSSTTEKQAKPKTDFSINFETTPESMIYLLAFDKRLAYLSEFDNSVRKNQVKESLRNFNETNWVHAFKMDEWHKCSNDENTRVQNKRIYTGQQSDSTGFYLHDENEEDEYNDTVKADEEEEVTLENLESRLEEQINRDDFPEVWIFDEFKAKDYTIEKKFKVPDSMTTWMISGFALHPRDGLAIMNPEEITVKNEFFVVPNLPYAIRYNEVFRLDIMIYNYLKTKNPLKVELKLARVKKEIKNFEFFEYKMEHGHCSSKINDGTSITKGGIMVDYRNVKRVSFYVRAIPNSQSDTMEKNVKFRIEAKGVETSKLMQTYSDIVTIPLKVIPIGVKEYHNQVISKNHEVSQETSGIVASSKYINSTAKTSKIEIIAMGDYLSKSLSKKNRLLSSKLLNLWDQTAVLKTAIETYRYQKLKTDRTTMLTKNEISAALQQTNAARRKPEYSSEKISSAYNAYYADILVNRIDLAGDSGLKRTELEAELDAIKNHHLLENGSFENFGTLPYLGDINNITKYGQTAFVIVPFLKHSENNTRYTDVIKKAINFISETNIIVFSNVELAFRAYAFALIKNEKKTKDILKLIEDYRFVNESANIKCYKLKISSDECDVVQTAYTALAYMAILKSYANFTSPNHNFYGLPTLMQIINWLADGQQRELYRKYPVYEALAAEVFSEAVKHLRTIQPNLIIDLENDLKPKTKKSLQIFDKNSDNVQVEDMPKDSTNINYKVNGVGFWSLAISTESIRNVGKKSEVLNLEIKPNNTQNARMRNVEICVTFPKTPINETTADREFIFEVEMPSGYTFAGIHNKLKNVVNVDVRRKNTLAILKLIDVLSDYCLNVQLQKQSNVEGVLKSAGVLAYQYSKKDNIAIEFYGFPNDEVDECSN